MCSDSSSHTPSRLSVVGDALALENLTLETLALENPCISPDRQPHTCLKQRYRLLKPLGQGSFGKTFLAVDEPLAVDEQPSANSFCVVKQLLSSSPNPRVTERFRQEAQRLADVGEHPQIPRLLDCFEQDGQLFMVQEWIDGTTLEQDALEQPFDEGDVWTLLRDLLPVLQYLHDRHIIHRDIKPANIIRRRHVDKMVGNKDETLGNKPSQFVLVDFGAAKQVGGLQSLTTGTLIGSAEYAAPEQIRGQAVFASDLYSLGVTCLALLTQMSPFDLYDMGNATWEWQAYLPQPISASLKQILCTLLQPATRRRYRSAAAVLTALDTLTMQADQPVQGGVAPRLTATVQPTTCQPLADPVAAAAIATMKTAQTVRAITAATVYSPQTQRWHRLAPAP